MIIIIIIMITIIMMMMMMMMIIIIIIGDLWRPVSLEPRALTEADKHIHFKNTHATYARTHTHTHTHTSVTVSRREGYWDGKRCEVRMCEVHLPLASGSTTIKDTT